MTLGICKEEIGLNVATGVTYTKNDDCGTKCESPSDCYQFGENTMTQFQHLNRRASTTRSLKTLRHQVNSLVVTIVDILFPFTVSANFLAFRPDHYTLAQIPIVVKFSDVPALK